MVPYYYFTYNLCYYTHATNYVGLSTGGHNIEHIISTVMQ